MYSPIGITTAAAPLALSLTLLLSLTLFTPVSAFLSPSSSSLRKGLDMELHRTIDNIRTFLNLEQKPKYFLRGAEQLCTEVELGSNFFTEVAMKEAWELDQLVRTQPKELDFSTGVELTKEIDAQCVKLGGSSFLVTFAPDKECDPDNYEGGTVPESCKSMITIKNFPICLANCICADVAAAKMSDKVTIVRTNGELNDVENRKKQQQQQQQQRPAAVPSASDEDEDGVTESNMDMNTSSMEDAPILRVTSTYYTNNENILTGILFLAAGILVVATVTLV